MQIIGIGSNLTKMTLGSRSLTDLYLPGAWTAVLSLDLRASGRAAPHQT